MTEENASLFENPAGMTDPSVTAIPEGAPVPEPESKSAVQLREVKAMQRELAPVSIAMRGGVQVDSLEGLWRLATWAAKSGLAPKDFQGNPEACALAIELALELGLPPMQGLQNIAVIGGRPSIYGDLALAVVRASGKLSFIEERLDGEIAKDAVAVCTVVRRGEEPVTRTFSIADAKRAGLWSKAGTWTFYPQRMLQMRARAFALRDAFPDVLKGVAIAEEVIDIEPVTVTQPKPEGQSKAEEVAAAIEGGSK